MKADEEKAPESRPVPSGENEGDRVIALGSKKERRIIARVYALGDPLCEAEGMELVHVEYQREPRGRTLRLYIDKPGGTTLDDCVNISRQVSDLLDVSIEDIGAYHLEVSSPGIERPLGRERDFVRFKGEKAHIKTSRPVEGKKTFKGVLGGVSDGAVVLTTGDRTVAIPFEEIRRARLIQ